MILLSRNSADTGLRVFNSIKHYGLDITRAAFTKGEPTSRYVPAFGAHLFLSADQGDVRRALDEGHAAATIFPSVVGTNETDELRIAFDGERCSFRTRRSASTRGRSRSVLQSDPTRRSSRSTGGPFKEFLAGLHRIQADFPEDKSPIRTALVTARSAPAHERVIRTLRAWNIRIDEALFLGGLDKGEFLRAFPRRHLLRRPAHARRIGAKHVAAGHVPHGVADDHEFVARSTGLEIDGACLVPGGGREHRSDPVDRRRARRPPGRRGRDLRRDVRPQPVQAADRRPGEGRNTAAR